MPRTHNFSQISSKLKTYYHQKKRLPSFSEMQTLLGYRSKGGVSGLIPHLVKRGILKKDTSGRLLPTDFLREGIRLLGSVQAGFPSPAEEELIDTLSLDEFLIKNPTASYLLRVSGDSMIDEGIKPGDLVIVERGREPKTGDVVIAEVDGEWTMKFFEKTQNKIVLRAANKKYPPIHPARELTIGGVVVACVRKYK